MPKASKENVFQLKNFGRFHMQPSLSVHFSGSESVSQRIARLLKDWFIKDVFFTGNILENSQLQSDYKHSFSSDFETVFRFIPDVQSYLADHPDVTKQILRSRIFSGTQYVTRQDHWGNELFYFYGHDPEIIPLGKPQKKLHIPRAEHVFRIYHLPSADISNDTFEFTDITASFNVSGGWLDPVPKKGILFILRRYVLTHSDKPDERFNLFEVKHLERLLKIFKAHFQKRYGKLQNVYFDFDSFLNPVQQYTEADFQELLIKPEHNFERELIRFWLTDTQEFTAYRLQIALFFQQVLKPILDKSAQQVRYLISADNPYLQTLRPGKSFLLRIDPIQFEPGSPYYLKAIIHLKRSESIRYSEGIKSVPVRFGSLLNIGVSFYENYDQFNSLWLYGANHIHLECSYPGSILSQLKKSDPYHSVYLKWFSRLHQIGHFLKQGTPRTEILVLYPTFDEQFDLFNASLEELHRSGPDYTLVDLETFISDERCAISGNQILFGKQRFYIILLPAIRRLPMSVPEKLKRFIENGGIVLTIGQIPQECSNPQQQTTFLKLNHQLWFKGSHTRSTSFKEFPSGGKTYFQQDISLVGALISDMQKHIQSFIQSPAYSVRYRLREERDHYILFIANTDHRHSAPFEFKTRFVGRPYEWDFESGTSTPYAHWYLEDGMLYIKDELPAAGHLFLLINKHEGEEVWQIRQSLMKGIRIHAQSASELVFSGHIRRPGYYYNILQRNKESREVAVQVSNRLPILSISSKNWYLESEKIKGGVNLGNYARYLPYGYGRFSYNKIIILEEHYLADQQLTLQLGKLKDWCIVKVNDQIVSKKLTPPWEFDITDYVKAGENKISIIVINNASNRLAKENDRFPVREYGLFGPVKIVPAAQFRIEVTS